MSVVRPEFGPTLPELVGPHVRALPRAGRIALAAAAALAFIALAALAARQVVDTRPHVTVRAPVAYRLTYAAPLREVRPRGGETLRLRTPAGARAPQSLVVRPLRLAPYRGDPTSALMVLSANLIPRMRATIPGFVWRGDGRVSYHGQPGYEIQFQARIRGRTTYGRRTLLLPPGGAPRRGADITALAARSAAVPTMNSVGDHGPLAVAMRSFRFGAG